MIVKVSNNKDNEIFQGEVIKPAVCNYAVMSFIFRKVNQYPYSDIKLTLSYKRDYEGPDYANDLFEDLPF